MRIKQMILVRPDATLDTKNDLTFVIYTNKNITRWSVVNNSLAFRILNSYEYAFNFKEIYVRETPEEN